MTTTLPTPPIPARAPTRAAGWVVPYITSVAATAIVFAQMFDRDYGLLNWLLGLVGIEPIRPAGAATS